MRLELAFVLPSLPRQAGLFARVADIVRPFLGRLGCVPVAVRPSAEFSGRPLGSMSLADQWSRLTSILTVSGVHAESARHLQGAAMQQLDLAQYALSSLVDELSAVMGVDGRRDRKATLHVLGTSLEISDGNSRHSLSGHALAA